jgi:hypothetical protein
MIFEQKNNFEGKTLSQIQVKKSETCEYLTEYLITSSIIMP